LHVELYVTCAIVVTNVTIVTVVTDTWYIF